MTKDYYKILGISESCTEQELKSAYRKLARKWHPDIAGNTENVVKKFKEINEAYEMLSDKTKKAEYDTVRRYYNYSSGNESRKKYTEEKKNTTRPDFSNSNNKSENKANTNEKKSEEKSGFNFNWEEFITKYKEYANKFEQAKNKSEHQNEETKNAKYGNATKGKDINTDVEITITEAINGTVKIINMLHTQVCPKCGGRKFINGNKCSNCNGKGETSEHRRFTVKIPAGVKDKSKIRLAGEGEKGTNGGKNGDLYITVYIKAAVDYKTDGNNIIKTLTLAPFEAVLGGQVQVKTLDGNITVKISPCTQNGQKIRLSGCGINVNGKIGDMILIVEIQIPKNISEYELELYKKLSEVSSQNVR